MDINKNFKNVIKLDRKVNKSFINFIYAQKSKAFFLFNSSYC